MRPQLLTGRLTLLLLLCLALPACTGNAKVTKANFDRIKPGMTLAEVEAILDKGDAEGGVDLSEGSGAAGAVGLTGLSAGSTRSSSVKWVKWGDDKKYIRVGFVGDRVAKGMIQQQGL